MSTIYTNVLYTCIYHRQKIYGVGSGGGGSQPPLMIVFHKQYTELPVEWNVRQLGKDSEDTNRLCILYTFILFSYLLC